MKKIVSLGIVFLTVMTIKAGLVAADRDPEEGKNKDTKTETSSPAPITSITERPTVLEVPTDLSHLPNHDEKTK